MASRIPPLLDAYLHIPPENSLVLLTSVLGSTTNWLVLRYLYSLLSTSPSPLATETGIDSPATHGTSVVLVSFLRDYAFWKDGAGKLGVDLDALTKRGKFVFVDGLTGLFRTSYDVTPENSLENATGKKVLSANTLQHLRRELEGAIAQIQRPTPEERTVFIADQLDLLLAASGDSISSQELRELMLSIREVSCSG